MTAIHDVDLVVEPGEFCAIVGPTGCGKSTTLTLAAGLERPAPARCKVSGKPVDGITKGASFVFQSDALLPWKTVRPTSRWARCSAACPRRDSAQHGARLAATSSAWPASSSTIRTSSRAACASASALAAALINEPSILLMDEPFSALDVQTARSCPTSC